LKVPLQRLLDRLKAGFGMIPEDEARRRLLLKYDAFRHLVETNTKALESMADMQAKATGEYVFDRAYVDASLSEVGALALAVVENLNLLSSGRHRALGRTLERITREMVRATQEEPRREEGPEVLELSLLARAPLSLAGGKTRRLAEIRNDIDLPVPDGFCITSGACWQFLAQGDLLQTVAAHIEEISLRDKDELADASRAIRDRVLAQDWPEPVARKILAAFDDLERRNGSPLKVSVRSSAVGEDGEFSFAGQFDSVLNVDRPSLLRACRQVLSSQFGPRALVYVKAKGMEDGVPRMAIGIIAMVDARASGVLYTRDPKDPQADTMTIAGQWGLGCPTVDGSQTPDVFRLSGRPTPTSIEVDVSPKSRMLLCGQESGLMEVDVPGWMREEPCLTKEQAGLLGTFGDRLERHFGRAQDVEWALDSRDALYILQSRPLRISQAPKMAAEVMRKRAGLAPILSRGVVACRGCSSGRVVVLASEEDIRHVPRGAVLVAASASPRLAEAVDRVAAFVTDRGSAAGHLATVAREFGIPAILGAGSATSLLKDGMTVTVDGELGNIYEGRVEALLSPPPTDSPEVDEPLLMKRFRAALAHITPLHLTDPRDPGFKASRCKTVHDVLRFAHEMAVQEMFDAGRLASRETRNAIRLHSPLPMDLFFIDLGGGLDVAPGIRTAEPGDFRCRPLIPLWQGMLRVPWRTDAAADASGMASVLSSSLTARDVMALAAEPNFAIVSEHYLNLSFRLGYHFSRIDAYLGDQPEDNYASFLFQGGAGDAAGRSLRVKFLAAALEDHGFEVHVRRDALFARTHPSDGAELAPRLHTLGRLMVATRQADTMFIDVEGVERALAAFRAGDDTLGLGAPEEGAP
jgi:pyruvate, water dikinase